MTKQEIQEQVNKMTKLDGKYLMGTKAYHQLAEISRDKFDLFCASGETEGYYIGMWVTGFGYFNVCFPKETSRELTKKEIKKYNKTYVQVGSQPPIRLKI